MRFGTNKNIKFLSKETLIKVLKETPDDSFLAVNNVGNITVFTKDKDGEPSYQGYVDFSFDGEYCT